MFHGFTDLQAKHALQDEVFASSLYTPQQTRDVGDILAAAPVQKISHLLPGANPQTITDIFKKLIPKRPKNVGDPTIWQQLNPWYTRGAGSTEDLFTPTVWNRALGMHTEGMNRISPFVELLRQGYDPAVAVKRVMKSQGDYEALSAFEKTWMRRFVPFYTYSRRMIPSVAEELLKNPGGRHRNLIRAMDTGRREGGFVPEHLGTGTYIPIGERKDGVQASITQFDLPIEQLNLIDPRGIKKTGLKLLGMTNPLFKVPMEMATGKQFFTDRELVDLEGRVGRLGTTAGVLRHPKVVPEWIEQLGSNAPPASTILNIAGTATDSRKSATAKALNILTGIKISHTDMNKAEEMQVRNLIESRLRGQPGVSNYENLYVSPEELPFLSPEDRLLMQLNETMKRRSQNRRRKEKAK